MSIGNTVYYLIRPKDALLSRLSEHPTDVDVEFTHPKAWSRQESTHDCSLREHRIAYIKVLFLACLCDDYPTQFPDGSPNEFGQWVHDLLGTPPLTPSVFDQWWSIEKYDDIRTRVEQIEMSLDMESLSLVAAPGLDYVRERLHHLTEQKTRNAKQPFRE